MQDKKPKFHKTYIAPGYWEDKNKKMEVMDLSIPKLEYVSLISFYKQLKREAYHKKYFRKYQQTCKN